LDAEKGHFVRSWRYFLFHNKAGQITNNFSFNRKVKPGGTAAGGLA
jgi:hypothetical protein